MSKNKKQRVNRNRILAIVAKNDPTRYRERVVESKKSKEKRGKKKNTRAYLSDEVLSFFAA